MNKRKLVIFQRDGVASYYTSNEAMYIMEKGNLPLAMNTLRKYLSKQDSYEWEQGKIIITNAITTKGARKIKLA